MKKWFLPVLLALLLVACGGGGGADDGPPDCSATLWGDSIAVRIPPQIVGFDVVNKAIPGSGVHGRLAEFLADPVTTRFTVIQLGMNDLPTTATPAEQAARMQSMVQHVEKHGGTAIITGISGTVGYHDAKHAEFDAAVRTLAPFVDWGAVPYLREELPDGVHPTPSYEARLAAALQRQLLALAPECAVIPK